MENVNKKSGKVTTVLFGLWVCIAYLLAQGVVSLIGVIPAAVSALQESNGDMGLYQQIYLEKMTDGGFLTILQVLGGISSLIVVGIWYYNGYVKKEFKPGHAKKVAQKLCNVNDIVMILAGTLAIYSLAVLIQMATSSIMPEIGGAVNDILDAVINGNPVLGFIAAVILAPFGEEICVRGIIVRRSMRAYGIVGVMIISAVFFGVLHMNPIQGLYALPMGLFWGFLAYKYNSVIPSICCHMINNFIGVIIGNFAFASKIWVFVIVLVVLAPVAVVFGKKVEFAEETVEADPE